MPLHAGSHLPADAEARSHDRAPAWRRPKVVFLALLLVVLAAYTEMAFALEWRTTAGRIGPGFFPRLLGVAGLAVTLWSLVVTLRAPDVEDETVALEDEVGDADLGKHPRLLALMVLAAALFAATLLSLGAIVASALFLAGMLWTLNRTRPVVNVAVSIGLPLVMYLLFQTLLNAGLPAGVLPFL
ncbi:tripartite tricarboxylate transporter TctB family protein [Nocardioides aequoreus]|uniref:tripartite tricarboxylate transporter TctB family protein n=1 Tax=Nocardioides aequoreus TaxID=397278 RepID=UPI0012F6553A|nr:tripartite tricarboxylate transporter TctB family protein [Nocardioides aequoreus]